MIYIKDAKVYATVWKVENKGKYAEVRMSTSEKDKDGKYINSNWNFVRFVGKAYDKIMHVKERDRICISAFKATNITKDNENGEKRTYFGLTVFDFDCDNSNSAPMMNSDDCPF